MAQRLFIFDPSLQDLRGHHYTLTRNITLSAQAAGWDVSWVASSGFKQGGMDLTGVKVLPVLKSSMYDAYKGGKAPDARIFRQVEGALYKALAELAGNQKMTPDDRLLLHTADGVTYQALARLLTARPLDRLPRIHVCTPYDPVGVMPNRADAGELAETIGKLAKAGHVDSHIFFYAENELLADHLSDIWSVPVRPLPLPSRPKEATVRKAASIQFRREKFGIGPQPFVCGVLGSARLEKGFHYLPYVVSRSFEFIGKDKYKSLKPSDLHFAFQASPQVIGYNPTVKNAIAKMQTMPRNQVTLLTESLSNEDYARLLEASDAILLPYEQEKYRVRGSGVIAEAITAAKIPFGTKDSYLGYMAEKWGGASAERPIDFAKAILDVLLEKKKAKTRMQATAIRYTQETHYLTYWPRCLEAEAAAAGVSDHAEDAPVAATG